MINVALMMSDNPYAPNGAAGYLKRLFDSKEIAKKYGIDEVFFCHGGANYVNSERYVSSFIGKTKLGIKNALLKTRLGTNVAVKLTMYRRAENAIAMYDRLEREPDVVVFNDIATHDLFSRRYPSYRGVRVQIMHNSGEFGRMIYLSMPKVDPGWVERVETSILASSDIIVHVGAKSKILFDALHPECSGKSVHIHTGINDMGQNPRKKSDGKLHFVCVGTVSSRKNQSILLDVAADELIRERCSFTVVGGGPEYEACREKANVIGLSDAVNYVGPSSNVVEYYRIADAFLSVSRDEGLPTAALEAMSCGLPLVLTDVGSCAELIDGNGVLMTSCDAQGVTAGIRSFISLFDEGKISGVASRKMFESMYTTEAMWHEYASLLRNSLGVE